MSSLAACASAFFSNSSTNSLSAGQLPGLIEECPDICPANYGIGNTDLVGIGVRKTSTCECH